jgi:hypothetical protein
MTAQIDKTKWPKVETGQDALLMYGDKGLRDFIDADLMRKMMDLCEKRLQQLEQDNPWLQKEKPHD